MRLLEGLVGEWDVTMTHAWFLDGLDTAVSDGDEVTILPAVAGG